MKPRIWAGIAGILALAGTAAFGGSDTIIRQHARELSNQNNVRQGVPAPAQPAPAPARSATAAQPTALPAGLARFQTDMASVKKDTPATTAQVQLLTQDLLAMAGGGVKPSAASANKCATDLAAALSSKQLSATDRSRLAGDINAALNPGTMPVTQRQAIVDDVQAIFQANNLPRKDALVVAADVKALTAGK